MARKTSRPHSEPINRRRLQKAPSHTPRSGAASGLSTQKARQALAHLEAKAAAAPVPAKSRSEVEHRLAEAEARRAEPWQERLDGAAQALAEADQEVMAFAADHIDELIADAEQQVAPAVARMNAMAVELANTITECHHASARITEVLHLGGFRVRPGAVGRLTTDELAQALAAFNLGGGQAEVRLDRRLVPALAALDESDAERATSVEAA